MTELNENGNITSLHIENFRVLFLPQSIENLEYLNNLKIINANLQYVPTSINNLPITNLDLSWNNILRLDLADFNQLVNLNLEGNELFALPLNIEIDDQLVPVVLSGEFTNIGNSQYEFSISVTNQHHKIKGLHFQGKFLDEFEIVNIIKGDLSQSMELYYSENDELNVVLIGLNGSYIPKENGTIIKLILNPRALNRNSEISDIEFDFIGMTSNGLEYIPYEIDDSAMNKQSEIPEVGKYSENFELLDVFPNPFNASTMVKYKIPNESDISIRIIDINGRVLETIHYGKQLGGTHSLQWNSKNVSSGIYFIQLEYKSQILTKKIQIIK